MYNHSKLPPIPANCSPILQACYEQKEAAVADCLLKGNEPWSGKKDEITSPLHCAVLLDNQPIIQRLVRFGHQHKTPKYLHKMLVVLDHEQKTPAQLACEKGLTTLFNELQAIDSDFLIPLGRNNNLLILGFASGNEILCNLLLAEAEKRNRLPQLLAVKDKDQRDALHAAASGGNLSLVERLIGIPMSLHSKTTLGQVPLYFALSAGHLDCAKILVARDPKLLFQNLADDPQSNPLTIATEQLNHPLIEWLLQQYANPSAPAEEKLEMTDVKKPIIPFMQQSILKLLHGNIQENLERDSPILLALLTAYCTLRCTAELPILRTPTEADLFNEEQNKAYEIKLKLRDLYPTLSENLQTIYNRLNHMESELRVKFIFQQQQQTKKSKITMVTGGSVSEVKQLLENQKIEHEVQASRNGNAVIRTKIVAPNLLAQQLEEKSSKAIYDAVLPFVIEGNAIALKNKIQFLAKLRVSFIVYDKVNDQQSLIDLWMEVVSKRIDANNKTNIIGYINVLEILLTQLYINLTSVDSIKFKLLKDITKTIKQLPIAFPINFSIQCLIHEISNQAAAAQSVLMKPATALEKAVITGDLGKEQRKFALHKACLDRNADAVRASLKAGDPFQLDEEKQTALMHACRLDESTLVKLILNSIADPERRRALIELTTENKNGVCSALLYAATSGSSRLIELLFSYHPKLPLEYPEGSALECAAARGHTHVIQALLSRGANILFPNPLGTLPIHLACENQNVRVIDQLIKEAKRRKQLPAMLAATYNTTEEKIEHTPLHTAIFHSCDEGVRLLLDAGADPLTLDADGSSSLHLACQQAHLEIVKALVKTIEKKIKDPEKRKKALSALNAAGNSPLHEAYLTNLRLLSNARNMQKLGYKVEPQFLHSVASVIIFLIQGGADLETKNQSGYTLLGLACLGGDLQSVDALIRRKANVNESQAQGENLLHTASVGGNSKVLLLVAAGIDDLKNNINAINDFQQTPLMLAHNSEIQETLIKYGANLDAINSERQTALHLACIENDLEKVKTILSYNPTFKRDQYGRNPLHYAVINEIEQGHKVIHLLLDKIPSYQLLEKDKYGLTVLDLLLQQDCFKPESRTSLNAMVISGECLVRLFNKLIDARKSLLQNDEVLLRIKSSILFSHAETIKNIERLYFSLAVNNRKKFADLADIAKDKKNSEYKNALLITQYLKEEFPRKLTLLKEYDRNLIKKRQLLQGQSDTAKKDVSLSFEASATAPVVLVKNSPQFFNEEELAIELRCKISSFQAALKKLQQDIKRIPEKMRQGDKYHSLLKILDEFNICQDRIPTLYEYPKTYPASRSFPNWSESIIDVNQEQTVLPATVPKWIGIHFDYLQKQIEDLYHTDFAKFLKNKKSKSKAQAAANEEKDVGLEQVDFSAEESVPWESSEDEVQENAMEIASAAALPPMLHPEIKEEKEGKADDDLRVGKTDHRRTVYLLESSSKAAELLLAPLPQETRLRNIRCIPKPRRNELATLKNLFQLQLPFMLKGENNPFSLRERCEIILRTLSKTLRFFKKEDPDFWRHFDNELLHPFLLALSNCTASGEESLRPFYNQLELFYVILNRELTEKLGWKQEKSAPKESEEEEKELNPADEEEFKQDIFTALKMLPKRPNPIPNFFVWHKPNKNNSEESALQYLKNSKNYIKEFCDSYRLFHSLNPERDGILPYQMAHANCYSKLLFATESLNYAVDLELGDGSHSDLTKVNLFLQRYTREFDPYQLALLRDYVPIRNFDVHRSLSDPFSLNDPVELKILFEEMTAFESRRLQLGIISSSHG